MQLIAECVEQIERGVAQTQLLIHNWKSLIVIKCTTRTSQLRKEQPIDIARVVNILLFIGYRFTAHINARHLVTNHRMHIQPAMHQLLLSL